MAVTGGFEPPSPVSQTAGLANQWFQPLTHVTVKVLNLALQLSEAAANVDDVF